MTDYKKKYLKYKLKYEKFIQKGGYLYWAKKVGDRYEPTTYDDPNGMLIALPQTDFDTRTSMIPISKTQWDSQYRTKFKNAGKDYNKQEAKFFSDWFNKLQIAKIATFIFANG